MHCDDLAIHHHIDRAVEMEINPPDLADFGQRMPGMRAVIKCWQVADQTYTPNWSPADVFDQSVVGRGIWSNHHGAAGKFAVVESKKQAGPTVDARLSIDAQRKWSSAEAR